MRLCRSPRRSPLSALPKSARTLRGQHFDPRKDFWVLHDAVRRASLNFGSVKALLSPQILYSFKLLMIWTAENRAASSAGGSFYQLSKLFRFINSTCPDAITSVLDSDILNYRASPSVRADAIRKLRPLLCKWHSMGLPGMSPDVPSLLRSLRIRMPARGRAVRTHDPKVGPFTSIEFDGLISKLSQSIAVGSIDEDHAVMTQILIGRGIRTAQCALLKVCDITCESHDRRPRYILRVPQVKQRHREERSEFRERVLPESLGSAVYEHAKRVCARFVGVLADPASAPLLPARQPRVRVPGYEGHPAAIDLQVSFQRSLNKLEVYSERTGERLYIIPTRFRRTFATRAAAAGWSPHAIAESLGHGDTGCVMVYVEMIPDMTARIDRAVATEMAPLAQAFVGTLVNNESEAIRGSDPASRIFDARIDRSGVPLGSCGQFSFCGFNAPLACYTCQHFQPWLDGPHEAVRDYLLSRRALLLQTTSEQMAQINDRRILAAEQVIQMCAQAKAERAATNA